MVRFALVDDEDERRTQESSGVAFATPQQQSNSLLRRRKATPAVAASIDEASTGVENMDVEMFSSEKIYETVQSRATELSKDVFVMVENKKAQRGIDKSHIVEDEDVVESEISPSTFVPPTLSLIASCMNNRDASIVAKLTAKRSSVVRSSIDAGLRSGKLFRVGLDPSGKLLVPTKGTNFAVIEQQKPIFGDYHSVSLGLFQILISKCRKGFEYGECPLLQAPLALQNGGDENSHAELLDCLERMASVKTGNNEEARKAFQLLATLLEAPETSASVVIAGDRRHQSYSFNERRNQALLLWLIDVNAFDVDKEIRTALQHNNVAAAIFAAISGGDLDKAASIAADAGLLDLAITLNTDVQGCTQLAGMVYRASQSSINIPRDFLRSLRAVAGDDVMEESLYLTGSRLGWTRRLALKLLQNPSLDLQTLLMNYDELVKIGRAPFPSPKYNGSDPKVESVQYRILRAIADPKSLSLSEVVHTNGFTGNPHDFSYSFLLATTLVASGYIGNDELTLEKIANGFAAQLLSNGAWEWGLAAILCSLGKTTKSTALAKMKRAHDYVLKFYGPGDEARFLVDTIGIPSAWCSEALAYKSESIGGFIQHMNSSSPDDASEVLAKHLLPMLFFKDKGLSAIGDIPGDASPHALVSAVHRLRKLDTEVQSLRSKSTPTTAEGLTSLVNECQSLRKTFEAALVDAQNQDNLHSFAIASRVESKHMLREAILLVTKLDFQLASFFTA